MMDEKSGELMEMVTAVDCCCDTLLCYLAIAVLQHALETRGCLFQTFHVCTLLPSIMVLMIDS